MQSDLDDAKAKIEWADAQIDILQRDFRAFLERKPYRLREEPDPQGRGVIYFFQEIETVPKPIMVNAGAILHSQRSSLDALVYALAARNGHIEPTDTAFPFAQTEDGLRDRRVRGKIRRLSETNRDAILALKPYRGGNIPLYALHYLNLKDKHRRLHVTGVERGPATPTGMGCIQLIALWDGPFQDGDPVARWQADTNMNLDISLGVSLTDVPDIGRPPLIEMLRELSSMCRSIIGIFD